MHLALHILIIFEFIAAQVTVYGDSLCLNRLIDEGMYVYIYVCML